MLLPTSSWDNNHDYHSSANTDDIRVNHFKLSLLVDFEQQCLSGEVTLQFSHLTSAQSDNDVTKLIVDCRDLIIYSVTDVQENPLTYELIPVNDILGHYRSDDSISNID